MIPRNLVLALLVLSSLPAAAAEPARAGWRENVMSVVRALRGPAKLDRSIANRPGNIPRDDVRRMLGAIRDESRSDGRGPGFGGPSRVDRYAQSIPLSSGLLARVERRRIEGRMDKEWVVWGIVTHDPSDTRWRASRLVTPNAKQRREIAALIEPERKGERLEFNSPDPAKVQTLRASYKRTYGERDLSKTELTLRRMAER